MRKIDCIVIHHSASLSGSVAAFRAEHRGRGYNDIGYHAVLGNGSGMVDGQLGIGRQPEVVGAGVWGANTGKLHVCLVGDFHKDGWEGRHEREYARGSRFTLPSTRQMSELGHLLLGWGFKYGKHLDHNPPAILGHKEAAVSTHPTACPGDAFPLHLIREWYLINVPRVQFEGGGFISLKDTEDLAQFLAKRAYWTPDKRVPKAVAKVPGREVALVSPVSHRTVHIGPDDVRDIGGRTFVNLRTLAKAVGWEEPSMTDEGLIVQEIAHWS